jgi:hypothetical protein
MGKGLFSTCRTFVRGKDLLFGTRTSQLNDVGLPVPEWALLCLYTQVPSEGWAIKFERFHEMRSRKAILGKRVLLNLAIGVAAILLVLVVLAFLGPLMSQIPNEPCLTVGCESRIYVVLSG